MIVISQNKGKVRLVISDENMEYINGSQAVQILIGLEQKGKIPEGTKYISLTAFEDESTKSEVLKSGFTAMLSKPASKFSLTKCLEAIKFL